MLAGAQTPGFGHGVVSRDLLMKDWKTLLINDWKIYLQPAATVLVALSLGAMAIDQIRTSNARFACAEVFGSSQGMEKDLARLGLPKDGNYNNVRGYCRGFISPPEVDVPRLFDVNIGNWPYKLSGY